MFLNIKNTGTEIDSQLLNYINTNAPNIGFNQIYIAGASIDKLKEVDIKITGFSDYHINTISLDESGLTPHIINWLNTL